MAATAPPLLITRERIQTLIPHSGAMCLLDGVTYWDEERIECLAFSHRAADNPLRRGSQLPATAGIEYAAQAIAVHGGLLLQLTLERCGPPRRGYLVALSEVQLRGARLDNCEGPLRIGAIKSGSNSVAAHYEFTVADAVGSLLDGRLTIAFDE